MARGFGVAAALPLDLIARVAEAVEWHGYDSFWVNDTPGSDGLAGLAAAAAVTSRITLGVGVIPLDRRSPDEIIGRVAELGLPAERLRLGVGSGGAAGGVERVRAALPALHAGMAAPLLVGALGPRMCRLAGAEADGVVLNWLTAEWSASSADWVRAAAAEAGRPAPLLVAYVRTALPEGADRLAAEGERYAAIPAYGAHFVRMGVPPPATGVHGDPNAIGAGLAAFEAVLDEVVARAITPSDSPDELLALAAAAAPAAA